MAARSFSSLPLVTVHYRAQEIAVIRRSMPLLMLVFPQSTFPAKTLATVLVGAHKHCCGRSVATAFYAPHTISSTITIKGNCTYNQDVNHVTPWEDVLGICSWYMAHLTKVPVSVQKIHISMLDRAQLNSTSLNEHLQMQVISLSAYI